MLGIGGDEHDDRRLLQRGEKLEAVGAAQLDVEEEQLRPGAVDEAERVVDALRLADDLDLGVRRQQAPHRVPRQALVVDYQDPEHGSPSSTRVATTVLPPPA